ncbi:MAG: N-acetyl-gamma-glutamyl-phosphate reductase [Caldicoprobacterales bacterium]|jgi:N-acetyl-gamma-glutamyl-phosphate reductase
MKYKIYVDGQEGTTGLRIHEYLSKRTDLEILKIDYEKRRDIDERRKFLNEADLVFLCLPDAAAKEAASLIKNDRTKVIDASTAHRIHKDWVYGLPEMGREQRERIRDSKRVANPGCHSTGFILLVYPLIKLGILPRDYPLTCTSVTGYSGGGKSLIAKYEDENAPDSINSPKPYGLNLKHKHLPEMKVIPGLDYEPVFLPIVANFYKGMAVSVPIAVRKLNKKAGAEDVQKMMAEFYKDEKFIRVMPYGDDSLLEDGKFLNPEACNDTNRVEISVFGHEEQILLTARFDNLGKGASGAAVQNMNIMLGFDEDIGL